MQVAWRRWTAAAFGTIVVGGLALGASGVEAQATARVRVVHMSPDAPAVDVLVDDQRAISNLVFKSATDYASIPAGQHNVKVTPVGQNQTAVIEADLPLQAGQDLTVVATGRLAEIAALPLEDDNSAPSPGNAKVRFVHASPDAPAVDIAIAGGQVLFPNVSFRNASDYTQVPAGTYNLEVRPAGTQDVALSVPNVALQAGQNVTVFAAGLLGDNTLSAVPVMYPTAGQGGPGAAAMPRTGTGGALTADASPAGTMIAGLLVTIAVMTGVGAMVAAQRRAR
ncbi:MAG: DUF4397 domain-containing protein [Dehalococcoidia bacterium]